MKSERFYAQIKGGICCAVVGVFGPSPDVPGMIEVGSLDESLLGRAHDGEKFLMAPEAGNLAAVDVDVVEPVTIEQLSAKIDTLSNAVELLMKAGT